MVCTFLASAQTSKLAFQLLVFVLFYVVLSEELPIVQLWPCLRSVQNSEVLYAPTNHVPAGSHQENALPGALHWYLLWYLKASWGTWVCLIIVLSKTLRVLKRTNLVFSAYYFIIPVIRCKLSKISVLIVSPTVQCFQCGISTNHHWTNELWN